MVWFKKNSWAGLVWKLATPYKERVLLFSALGWHATQFIFPRCALHLTIPLAIPSPHVHWFPVGWGAGKLGPEACLWLSFPGAFESPSPHLSRGESTRKHRHSPACLGFLLGKVPWEWVRDGFLKRTMRRVSTLTNCSPDSWGFIHPLLHPRASGRGMVFPLSWEWFCRNTSNCFSNLASLIAQWSQSVTFQGFVSSISINQSLSLRYKKYWILRVHFKFFFF